MTENVPDLELSTARILRAILTDDTAALGQALVELGDAQAGMVAVVFAQLYIAERTKTMSAETLLRAVESQIVELLKRSAKTA